MTIPWRKNPLIYEINAWTWLRSLSDQYGQPVTLKNVPDAELDSLAAWGLDAIWLMGAWERSPNSQIIARDIPDLLEECRRALPDFTPEDVVGSPYAIRRYVIDTHLGGREGLAVFRQKLAERGLQLILDFVPNHVATDHPWLETRPKCLLQGTPEEMDKYPDFFFLGPVASHHLVFAYGRDPYSAIWTDTAQVNAFSPILRAEAVETLLDIASQCDGVRCDMAMLVTNRIFAQTWGRWADETPKKEYWTVVIPPVKDQYPDFLLVGEVYWDMEWELQQQGFDYTYDKRLYDRLVRESPPSIRGHLQADYTYQSHLIRLIENHDEQRAAVTLGPARDRPAAILITTLPGAALLHEGQFAGHRIKLPVQLGRRPVEADQPELETLYRVLLKEAAHPIYHQGEWRLREAAPAWESNLSNDNLIAYTWKQDNERRLVVVNYSATASQGRVALPDLELTGRAWHLHDVLNDADYTRDGSEMAQYGLYIDLKPWQAHIFEFYRDDQS